MINFAKLEQTKKRYEELEGLLGDSQIIADKNQYQKLAKEYAEITPIVLAFQEYKKLSGQMAELKILLKEKHDKDFKDLVESELKSLEKRQEESFKNLDELTTPKSPYENRDLIVEIRAGTGGGEASLFAADLFRMYTKYADRKGWKADPLSSHPSEAGGFKEVIFSISGKGAAQRLKWESGVHRVQRVPATEASGRIHTSTATVAVLYEPEEIEVKIDSKDLKIDVFRSSGPGGQSVNTTDSAVRLTHLPSGIIVVCQDERSQIKNRLKAMRVLRARLLEQMRRENFEKTSQDRKSKIGTAERSEKIRTYNFSDRRITDHRIGFSLYKLQDVLDGDLEELAEALMKAEKEEILK